MPRSALDQAERLARRGRFGEVVLLLEPQLPVYRESPRFYYLLGSACLRSSDMGGAYTYLKRAEQLDPEDCDTLLCLAAYHLRKAESQKAVEYYLSVLERKPRHPLATRALSFMRRPGVEEAMPRLVEQGKMSRFYPRPKGLPPFVLPAGVVAAALIFVTLLAPRVSGWIGGIREAASPRPEVAAIALNDYEKAKPVETGGSYRYILTEKEALAGFERAKSDFEVYRDNAALVELNRLILSNASQGIKEKARTLKGFVAAPDFRTVKDVPDYADVSKEPELYEGCAVVWKGSAANIEEAGDVTKFHFLVGYTDGKRLEGIVPVELQGQRELVPASSPFELLGVVRTGPGGLSLSGRAVHELRGN
jgi:tetratricopeptide (TPR) repeat protein